MLGVDKYTRKYINACKGRTTAQVHAYHRLTAAAKKAASADPVRLETAIADFEPQFFAGLVLELDHFFMHRLRGREGKDGNPLNEVRMLCSSIMENDGAMVRDRTIAYDAERSVLKFAVGDKIQIDEAGFKRLAAAFYAEMEKRFT